MVAGCVQHYSTHFIKKLGKSLEPFFHKVKKTAKKGQNWAIKLVKNADFHLFLPFFSFLVNFKQTKKFKNNFVFF